ncbi:hypothetical protein BJY01DRAFT_216874, partial [Aspergillus pseudoustus]
MGFTGAQSPIIALPGSPRVTVKAEKMREIFDRVIDQIVRLILRNSRRRPDLTEHL